MKHDLSIVLIIAVGVFGAAVAQELPPVTDQVAALAKELQLLTSSHKALGSDTTIPQERINTLAQELGEIESVLADSDDPESLRTRVQALEIQIASLKTDVSQDETAKALATRQDALSANATQAGLDMLEHFGVGLMLAGDISGPDRVDSASVINGKVVVNADRNVRAGVVLEYHTWMFCEHLDLDDPDYVRGPTGSTFTNGTYRAVPRFENPNDGLARGQRQDESQGQAGSDNESSIPSPAQLSDPQLDIYLKQVPPCNSNRRSSGLFVAVQPGSDELIDALGVGWMWRLPDKLRIMGNRTLNIGFGLLSDPNVQVLGDGFVEGMDAPVDSNGVPLQIQYRETDKTAFFITASIELGGQ